MLIPKTKLVLHFPYDKMRMFPFIFTVLFMLPGWITAEPGGKLPFHVGDHFFYDIKWGPIKVGEGELIVEDAGAGFPGDLRFVLLIRTTSWADAFYKVRNRVESYTDAHVTKSLLYKKDQLEGNSVREVLVNFDWDNQQAIYTSRGETREPIDIAENCHDPFSVLFAYRTREFILGENISIPVTDGKKTLLADITVEERERIKTKAGKFDCLRVRPDIKDLGGVFSKSDDARMDIWFSDDNLKLIVKMSSSVSVGSFKVELSRYILGDSR